MARPTPTPSPRIFPDGALRLQWGTVGAHLRRIPLLRLRREGGDALNFQQAIQELQEYSASVGCAIMQCSNTEVGVGTMNPLTFLQVLGPEPRNVA
ncbi:hypothetical protein ZWY2020_056252 [Hordeum vulgare]|nr:hypothetical protein ZWY2020_056252 [Hordeum vulgare]